jgi:hypothetical protein
MKELLWEYHIQMKDLLCERASLGVSYTDERSSDERALLGISYTDERSSL